MTWIESHRAVGQHPKTIQLAALLKVSMPTAVGHLHYLWWWALDFAPDGHIKRASAAVVARACLWNSNPERFWNALVESGFVDVSDDDATIHDWYDYAGRMIEHRRANAERMRTRRAALVHNPSDARAETETAHVRSTFSARAGATVPTVPDQPDRTGPTGKEDDAAAAVAAPAARATTATDAVPDELLAEMPEEVRERLSKTPIDTGKRRQPRRLNDILNGRQRDAES